MQPDVHESYVTGKAFGMHACHILRRLWSDMQGSTFKQLHGKLPAGRIFVAQELGVHGSYTLETSLAGDGRTRTHHTVNNLLRIGESLCLAIHDLVSVDAESLMEEVAAAAMLPANTSAPRTVPEIPAGPEEIHESELEHSPAPDGAVCSTDVETV